MLNLPRKVLGLAWGERAIRAALVRGGAGARPALLRTAEFAVPAGLGLDRPQDLGAALGRFLKAQGFGAPPVVVGLPGKWLLAKPRTLPPADPAAVAGMLQMQAERDFAGEARDWALDYTGQPGAAAPLLLLATPRARLDQVLATLAAAGLRPLAVTSATLALAGAAPATAADALLHLGSEGADLVLRGAAGPVLIQHLAPAAKPAPGSALAEGASSLATLARDLHRALALAPAEAGAAPPGLTVWDASGLSPGAWREFESELGLPLQRAEASALDLGVSANGHAASLDCYGAAVATALAGLDPRFRPIDFLHSRLAPPRRARLSPQALWAITLCAVLLALVAAVSWDWWRRQQDVADLKLWLSSRAKPLQDARTTVDRVDFARGWYDRRPAALECLREITLAFPSEGTIWVKTINLKNEPGSAPGEGAATRAADAQARLVSGSIQGTAVRENVANDVVRNLKASKQFREVQAQSISEADVRRSTYSFKIDFVYVGKE